MVVLAGCGSSAGAGDRTVDGVPVTLRVGLVPNIAPEQQQARYQPFADYLEGELGVTVELFVAADYAGVVAALASGRIDLAYLGGLTYVQAEAQVALTPLVSEVDQYTGTTRYLSAVVVRDEAPYTGLADLIQDGVTFAFGDVSSTSGSLYPRIMLVEAGADCHPRDLDRCPPLGRVYFTGGHDAAALAVFGGSADAAGLELRILRRLERDGGVPQGALRVVAQREVEGYPWVARTALGPRAMQRLTAAFTAVDDPALLDLLRARSYQPVHAYDYDEIRRHGKELGLVEAG